MKLFTYQDEHLSVVYSLTKNPDALSQKIHVHNDYELYCFVSGDARYMIEGREVSLRYGTVLLMRPGELHTSILDSDKPYERYVLNFTADALPEELRESLLSPFRDRPLGELNCYRGEDFPRVTPLELLSSFCSDSETVKLRMRTMLPALLMLLQTAAPHRERLSDTRSEGAQMVDFVNARLCDPVTVSMVTEEFHMSVSQVSRIFKAATGTTVGQYCLTKRLLKARRRIAAGMTAQQAAQECGFGCYSSFFRLYKKRFGTVPSSERNDERIGELRE
ncbi:MAG: AraC family transcriptional regulator [Clostridia bacterium]|nr:AraC family transcriptional regulator [Clostridia bacterium]